MSEQGSPLKRTCRAALAAGLALVVAGCVSLYRDHGFVPTQEDVDTIRLGVDTRDSVAERIGTPGASGVLNTGGYYYVSTRFRHYGAREPEPVSRELLAISFDQRGVARNIERFSLADGRVIPLQRRITDSGASDRPFLRQLLGNLGRIGPGTILRSQN